MLSELSCYIAFYSQVLLTFQPHFKSLQSLERQTVLCLQCFSIVVASCWGKSEMNTVTFTSAKWTCAFPPWYTADLCTATICSEAGSYRVLVIQVVDAKAHYLLHGSWRHETTSKARQSCHQSNVWATMYVCLKISELWVIIWEVH